MIEGKIYLQNGQVLFHQVMQTTNAIERMRGLLGRKPLDPGQAFLISPCSSIHTFGMTYPLDLIFINKDWQIKKVVNNLKPFRLAWCAGAYAVIEAAGGTLASYKLQNGTTLNWEKQ